MSGRQSKKLRQYFRREMRRQLEMVKPKPKYLPFFFWLWLMKVLLKVEPKEVQGIK